MPSEAPAQRIMSSGLEGIPPSLFVMYSLACCKNMLIKVRFAIVIEVYNIF